MLLDFKSKRKSLPATSPPLGQFCLEVQRREVEGEEPRKVNKMTEL